MAQTIAPRDGTDRPRQEKESLLEDATIPPAGAAGEGVVAFGVLPPGIPGNWRDAIWWRQHPNGPYPTIF